MSRSGPPDDPIYPDAAMSTHDPVGCGDPSPMSLDRIGRLLVGSWPLRSAFASAPGGGSSRHRRRPPLFGILVAALCIGHTGPSRAQEPVLAESKGRPQSRHAAGPAKDDLTPRLELMLRTMRLARDWHVGQPLKPQLVAGAISGLLAELDPEAEFYTRADLRRMARALTTTTSTIGLDVRLEPPGRRRARRGYRVINARDGSPAARSGLKAGDLITHFDGAPAAELSLLHVEHTTLAGSPGTRLHLTVERGPDVAPVELHLDRTSSPRWATRVEEAAPGVAYLRPPAMDTLVVTEMTRALDDWSATPARPMRGVVLDLRSVSSGNLESARALADAFLDAGVISATGARDPARATTYQSTPGDIAKALPMIVLIDAGTAGPAELVAAALQENGRARLLGSKSAGRGALRTFLPLGVNGEKGAIRITTARLLAPSGQPLDERGIKPDEAVEQTPPAEACRSLDQPDPLTPGLCSRRPPTEDGQLARAVSLLGASHFAARGPVPPGNQP